MECQNCEDNKKRIEFLEAELVRASISIQNLAALLRNPIAQTPQAQEIKLKPILLYNEKEKKYEPASQDELHQFNEDAVEMLGVPLMYGDASNG